ncbi:MAG: glycosyltransferase family 4 protein [Candidatus Aminicenantes bacterium]|nr:MAG: glycosyltransferase family 4 protein [Candidatus Aminicenantes bacterium]
MEIHQFATSLTYGDAISDEMLEIQKALKEKGYKSEIFTRFYEPRMAKYAKDFREYTKISSPSNVVIFHFSIGSPVSKMFSRIPDKRIMIYHNITPYQFFLDTHRILSRECFKGRLEIKLFVDKVDLALGDSEFNRQELESLGYTNTGILPLLIDYSKFDGMSDPVVRQIYDNRKFTILFVGRVIPNKKFEDVIKTFHFYKKYFNPDSQLLLVGDFRGMERYLAALKRLVEELELSDVHFSGRVDFAELLACFQLADVYLSMSEHEGFGVPLVESFYLGLPVVAYAAGAIEETMNGGGILVRKKDFPNTAALLDKLYKDEVFREKVVLSQKKALEKFSRENVSTILLDHIQRVAKK